MTFTVGQNVTVNGRQSGVVALVVPPNHNPLTEIRRVLGKGLRADIGAGWHGDFIPLRDVPSYVVRVRGAKGQAILRWPLTSRIEATDG
jgi:hypothetical protein